MKASLRPAGLRFAIVVSRFNSFVTERLLAGAMDALTRTGADADLIDVVKAPGSWEIPWRPPSSRAASDTTRSSAWAPSSAARRRISIMSRPRRPRGWPTSPTRRACQWPSAC